MRVRSQVIYKKADAASLKKLLTVFADAFENHESYQGNILSDKYLGRLLAREDFIPLVADFNCEVVGELAA